MPTINQASCPVKTGSIYPEPYASMMQGRSSLRLGDAGGLTQFGVNLVSLEPGALSSLRHWHLNEDEFVMVTEGACTLVQDSGEQIVCYFDELGRVVAEVIRMTPGGFAVRFQTSHLKRDKLADPIMAFGRHPVALQHVAHVQDSREAAKGANGSGGGGCGCN